MLRKRRLPLILAVQIALMLGSLPLFLWYFMVPLVSPIIVNPFLLIGFGFLVMAMSLETVAYEEIPIIQISSSEENSSSAMVNKQNEPTPQAKRLHEALKERDIHNELEFDDGHKHIDIYIPSAKLNLEVDGEYHLRDSEQWFRDLKRDLHSNNEGKGTIHIPNHYVDTHLDELANVIAEVTRKKK